MGNDSLGPEWVACRKRPVVVHVREQRQGEQHVSTREGITPLKPDDLIMRGVEGEEYPIGRDLFNKTYDLVGDAEEDGREPQTLHRDAGTGRLVSEEYAAANPGTTVKETR